mgnify:CR=1 FL=1
MKKGKSISKHLQTDLQAEYFAIMQLAGDNPSVIQNRAEVKERWTKMIQSITTVDNASKQHAIDMLHNTDAVVLASMASYYLGTSSSGISYQTVGRYAR